MPEQLEVIAAKGLYTQPNPIADVPDGALDIADDVVITSDDVIEPRRGFTPSATFGTGSSRPHQIYEYGNFIYVHYDAVIGAQVGSTIGSVGGVYNPPPFTNAKVRFAEANKNLYVTTSTGVRRAEQTNVSFLQAGHPRAPAPMACLAKDPSVGGWLTAGNQVAYRVVWGYRDSNGNTVMGEPSGAVTVGPRNNSGDMVALYVPAPATAAGITTGSFFQVYRSAQSTTTPSEEMSLVYEGSYAAPNSAPTTITTLAYSSPALTVTTSSAHGLSVGNTVYLVYNQAAISTSSPFAGGKYTVASVPDATHFTVGYATTGTPGASGGNLGYVFGATDTVVVDTIPDELRGAALYTNPSQEGIAQANTPPPICRDMAPFKGCMAYANTVAKHRLTLTLLAVGAPNGLQVGDTVTVNGTTYTAAASESPTTFALYTGGTAAQNVAITAQSLVRVINFLGSVTAVYLSGAYDQPGIILFEEQGIGGSTFYATASAHGSAWSPPLPTSGTTVASSNDAAPNRIAWSKPGQPEAVPLLNYSAVGRKDKAILRITPLRDSLLVWKEDGLFRVTGEDPLSFRADQFDPTIHLVAGETAAALANSVFALTDQGVVQVNEAGVTVVSRPIEDKLKGLETTAASAGAWALGYETERSLILGTVSSTTDTYPTQVFVYNYFTRTWVRWARAFSCGWVSPHNLAQNKLRVGLATSNAISIERKSFDSTDYADEEFAVTVTNVVGNVLTLSSAAGIAAGDGISGSGGFATVTAVSGNTVTVVNPGFIAGAATVFPAYACKARYAVNSGGNPLALKQFSDALFLFRNAAMPTSPTVAVGFMSDRSGVEETINISGSTLLRCFVPQGKQRCAQLSVSFASRIARLKFELLGIGLGVDKDSIKVTT
jgi:hypothetical protein